MIRELQPGVLINDRLGKGERGVTPLCDFYTREQPVEIREIADFEMDRRKPWEACMTIGESWGYRRDDANFKSSADLIRALVDVASRGGNFLLNVGPTPEGEMRPEFADRLRDIGGWLAKNGESIYGTVAEPSVIPTAGKLTRKGSRLYLHLETHPGGTIGLPALKDDIQKVWFLETGEEIPFENATKTLSPPPTLPNEIVSTLAIELKR
jgi:alpha-L-fucosidase